MQSKLQDAPPMVKRESSTSPQPSKWIIKKPVDFAKVDAEDRGDESVETSSDSVAPGTRELIQTASIVEDAPPMVRKESSRSPQTSKKSRKRSLNKTEVDAEDGGDEFIGSTSNQLVLYNPGVCNTNQDVLPLFDHSESYTSAFQNLMASNPASRVLPSVGAFTVQCADCFKWRLIPTKEIYEEIREHILQRPFACEQARAWRPDITCDDPADISQDGSRLWAIDKPNIAQPPPGWERQLRIRGEGSTKFADVISLPLKRIKTTLFMWLYLDVKGSCTHRSCIGIMCKAHMYSRYYASPSGKKLRSMVEVQKYLLEHPEYVERGVKLSQFSFQIPRPLQENYVRKRPAVRMSNSLESGLGLPRPLEAVEVNPLSWVEPTDEDLPIPPYHGGPVYCHPSFESPTPPPAAAAPSPPEKKKGNRPKTYIKHSNSGSNSSAIQPAKKEL